MTNRRRQIIPSLIACALFAGMAAPAAFADMNEEWARSGTFGLNQTRGNSETLLQRVGARAERIEERYEWLFEFEWTYGESDKEKSAEFGRLGAEHKRLLKSRAYIDFMAEISYDAIAKLDYRVVTGPALGYFLLRNETFRLSAEAGPSYVAQKQGDARDNFFAIRIAEDFDWRVNDRARIWQRIEYVPRIDDFEQFLLNSEIGLESALSAALSLGVSLQHRHDSAPAEGAKRNDLYLVSTLKFAF